MLKLLEFQVIKCTSLERIFLGQRKTSLSQHAFDLKCMDSYASDARTKIKCKMSSDFVHEIFSVCAPYGGSDEYSYIASSNFRLRPCMNRIMVPRVPTGKYSRAPALCEQVDGTTSTLR